MSAFLTHTSNTQYVVSVTRGSQLSRNKRLTVKKQGIMGVVHTTTADENASAVMH